MFWFFVPVPDLVRGDFLFGFPRSSQECPSGHVGYGREYFRVSHDTDRAGAICVVEGFPQTSCCIDFALLVWVIHGRARRGYYFAKGNEVSPAAVECEGGEWV